MVSVPRFVATYVTSHRPSDPVEQSMSELAPGSWGLLGLAAEKKNLTFVGELVSRFPSSS